MPNDPAWRARLSFGKKPLPRGVQQPLAHLAGNFPQALPERGIRAVGHPVGGLCHQGDASQVVIHVDELRFDPALGSRVMVVSQREGYAGNLVAVDREGAGLADPSAHQLPLRLEPGPARAPRFIVPFQK